MGAQKNNTLELLKLFASYMVVFIHISFYGNAGVAVDALARFAVPFFFLVSGYFSYNVNCEKIKKRTKHILALFVFAAVCCTVFQIVLLLKSNPNRLFSLLNAYTDFNTYVDLLVFNRTIISGHLWYLLAALYVYVIFYFATKFKIKEKVIFIVALLLLVLHLLLGEGLAVFGIKIPMQFIRNFALMGIPFFAMGLFVKKYKHKFQKVPGYMVLVFAVIGAFETIISCLIFGQNELYIGSLFILAAVVAVFIKYSNVRYPRVLTALDGCSTYIYIFHIVIATALNVIYSILGIDIYSSLILENLHPIVVCIASTIFAYLFIKIFKKPRKSKLTA